MRPTGPAHARGGERDLRERDAQRSAGLSTICSARGFHLQDHQGAEAADQRAEEKMKEAGGEREPRDRERLENAAYREVLGPEEKRLTAKQIRECDADVLYLQVVENLPALRRFAAST
jgi:hypothetical protein